MILQVADVGVNRFLKSTYQREYTASICSTSLLKKAFDDTERFGCLVRTVLQLAREHKTIVNCFTKCGLLSGYKEVSKHFHSTMFSAGIPMRDDKLLLFTTEYIIEVLSP